jgi:hypothetical protein
MHLSQLNYFKPYCYSYVEKVDFPQTSEFSVQTYDEFKLMNICASTYIFFYVDF